LREVNRVLVNVHPAEILHDVDVTVVPLPVTGLMPQQSVEVVNE
jgi:hypothetical protein